MFLPVAFGDFVRDGWLFLDSAFRWAPMTVRNDGLCGSHCFSAVSSPLFLSWRSVDDRWLCLVIRLYSAGGQ
jgi:hypothetical protein